MSRSLERVSSTKLLGTHIDYHLKWEENVKQVSASCYCTLAILKKLRNFVPFNIREHLSQALVCPSCVIIVLCIIIYHITLLNASKEFKQDVRALL